MCSNYGPAPGSHVYIGFYREKHVKMFLSETTRLKALLFGMEQHLVNRYQVCSNYVPGAENGFASGSRFTWAYIGKNIKRILLSETIRPRALIFGL